LNKIEQYIRQNTFSRPTLVLDVEQVEENYKKLKKGLGSAHIHYAVKANPQKEILERLVHLGSRFDAASMGEIVLCIDAGAKPDHISFGNTVKRVEDIKYAYMCGIRLFAVDSVEEVEKVAQHAPGSDVFVRILVDATEAEWPLSKKFGCDKGMALVVMDSAKLNGLNPMGISFHIGSQTRHPQMWDDTLVKMADIWNYIKSFGYTLTMLNLGGGFPAYYGKDITDPEKYTKYLTKAVKKHFGDVDYLMAEPGRGMVGNAGYMAATVLLVSQKSLLDSQRWVYLDVGKFSGLAETDEEAIKYQFIVPDKDTYPDLESFVMAGPTCDSADVLYTEHKVTLPACVAAGDKIIIKNCGAYTTTYSTVAFNGFPPLEVKVL
jgi:ornithine decarboxylase